MQLACEVCAGPELLRLLIPAVLIIVGWLVVHSQTAARDKEKARREVIAETSDALASQVSSILSIARTYHLSERDLEREVTIKMLLQDLSLQTSELSEICKDGATLGSCRSAIRSLRRSVTGQHFEDEHDGPLRSGHEQLECIAADVVRAKQMLLRLKHRQFAKT